MNFRYLSVSQTPSVELLELLNNNIIGTPGQSMLYQHLHVIEKLKKIRNPYFIKLERSGQIAGTCCFCKRDTINNGNQITSNNVRYFSFKEIFRKKALSVRTGKPVSALRVEINALLQGNGFDVKPGEKLLHYAYVDTRNERSAILCQEFGFETVRQYTTIVFSRLFPKKITSNKVVEVEAESVQILLADFYQGFNTVTFENLKDRKFYFVENESGQRVAGVQVNPDEWRIHAMPGIFLNLMLGLFTHLPIFNRLISKKFKFLTFENMYWISGGEKYLELLMEHLLRTHQVYSGICVVDRESKLYSVLKSLRLGLVNRLNKEVNGNVICRFENFSELEREVFKEKPAYISGIDVT